MNKEIYWLRPVTGKPKHHTIVWLLGNTCPYSCSYCGPQFHDGSSPWQDADLVLSAMAKMPRAHVIFSGGEPSYHPQIERILTERPKNVKISMLSNASRPYDFWDRVHPLLLSVVFSYHIEQTKYDRFIEVARRYKDKIQRINLPMLMDRWEACLNVYWKLIEEGFRVSAKPIVENFGFEASKVVGYADWQREWIESHNEDRHANNLKVTFMDDRADPEAVFSITSASRLLASGLTNFKGMSCETPTEFMNVDFDGTIWDASCKQRTAIGSLKDGWTVPQYGVVCEQDFCWCHTDINCTKSAVLMA